MVGANCTQHKRVIRNGKYTPLCGDDQLGYMWDEDEKVSCRACQILLKHPELPPEVVEQL